MRRWILTTLAAALALTTVSGVVAQEQPPAETRNVEVSVWRLVSDPTVLYIGARPEGGIWRTQYTPLDMSALHESGSWHQSNTVRVQVRLGGRVANVEVIVWRLVPVPAYLVISTRPEGGAWRTLNSRLDMSGLSRTGMFHQSNAVRVEVPLPDEAAVDPAAAAEREGLVAQGLEHARTDGLVGQDAAAYAEWFAHGKSLELDDEQAVAFASGALYFAVISEELLLGGELLLDYEAYTRERFVEPFEQALADGATPLEALARADEAFRVSGGWWPLASLEGEYEGRLAEDFVHAFEQTEDVGLAAHQFAAHYAGSRYLDVSEEDSLLVGQIIARAYRESDQWDARLRIRQALAYLLGYQQAQDRYSAEEPSRVELWADVYADAYVTGWLLATGRNWPDATNLAFGYANYYATAWTEWRFGRRTASLLADAHLRGEYHASQLGLTGDDYDDYAWEYHVAYFDHSRELGGDEARSHRYATAYAEARADGQSEEDARKTAAAAVEADE